MNALTQRLHRLERMLGNFAGARTGSGIVQMTRRRVALLVCVISTLLVLPPLGQRIIAPSDEVRFALLAKDMIERGVWFDLQVRGQRSWEKPPLYPWAIAAFSRVRGRVTEATAHAPIAGAAIGSVLFTFLLGDRLFNRRTGLWAGLIVATSYAFFGHSQLLLPDLIVVCFATMAGYAFWRAVSEPVERGALVGFYAAVGLGVFAKGPVGLLPVLVAALWLWSEHGPEGVAGRLWSPAGSLVFVGVTLIWLGPYLRLGAGSFAYAVVWEDWLAWYLGLPTPKNLANLAIDTIVGFLPWALVTPLAIAAAVRAGRNSAVKFALLWFAVPLVVIMLAENQRTRYLLPLYPGAALLVAWWADRHGAERTTAGRMVGWFSLVAAAVAITSLGHPEWFGPDQAPFVPGFSWAAFPLAAGAALVGTVMFWGLHAGRPAMLVHGVVAAMVVLLGYGIWLYNGRFNEVWDFKRLAASVERHAHGGEVGVFGGRWFSIDFYIGRPLHSIRTGAEFKEYLARSERPVVVVNGRTWGYVQGQISPHVRVLDQMTVGGQEMLILKDGGPPEGVSTRQ